ncbi:MAG TPA: monovalent cation/H+ antiporter complex subunit F [Candidatus Limnocylindria bacterium]|nr:monovalent cation/H+ antiporter complex subunit F [Candidatus Limnocylindria bacterium]
MTQLFLGAAAALLVLGLAYLYRLAAGPSAFDRILGLSGFTSNITLVLVLTGVVFGRLDMFVDIALGYALLSFVSVIAAARYFERLPEK